MLTRPRRGAWGELAATIRKYLETPVISCSFFYYEFDHTLCDLGASVNIMPKVTFEKLDYPCQDGRILHGYEEPDEFQ